MYGPSGKIYPCNGFDDDDDDDDDNNNNNNNNNNNKFYMGTTQVQ